MSTKHEVRSEATRRKLVDAATKLFAEQGYAATATEDIVEAAGVTRGALYHQFADKADLFRAVVEEIQVDVMRRIRRALKNVDGPSQQLVKGCEAFLDASLDPAIQRIVILDSPSVLDWEDWRELQSRCGLGLLRAGLEAAIEAGEVRRVPVEPLAQMLLGALEQSACMISRAAQKRKTREDIGLALTSLLEGVLRDERSTRASSASHRRPVGAER